MSPPAAVSVIVPARNARATLPRTLAALGEQSLCLPYEVIVVDDASSDGTAQVAASAPGPVRVVASAGRGPGAARNRGADLAQSRLLAFCDADVFPTRDWLRAGIGALQGADLVQGRVLPDPAARLGPFDRTIWVTGAGGLWESANLFLTRQLFERIGGFEDWLWPPDGKPLAEDVLFAARARRLGARTAFCPEALAYHAVFARDGWGFVRERGRLAQFPAIAARVPELRERFLYRRVFLDRRSARLDAALAGALAAVSSGSPLPLLAALPYLRLLRAHAQRGRGTGVGAGVVAAADLLADLRGLAALAQGSLRHRALVI